jgi:hypothetical protein
MLARFRTYCVFPIAPVQRTELFQQLTITLDANSATIYLVLYFNLLVLVLYIYRSFPWNCFVVITQSSNPCPLIKHWCVWVGLCDKLGFIAIYEIIIREWYRLREVISFFLPACLVSFLLLITPHNIAQSLSVDSFQILLFAHNTAMCFGLTVWRLTLIQFNFKLQFVPQREQCVSMKKTIRLMPFREIIGNRC